MPNLNVNGRKNPSVMGDFFRRMTVAAAIAFTALVSAAPASAQDAKGSPGHIRAVTSAVDDADDQGRRWR